MRSFKVTAVIIKRRNFLEKDRILTLFSREKGKIEVLAKGARRPGNRLSAHCDIGVAAVFHIHQTKTIDLLTETEPFFHPERIRGEFDKTQKIEFGLRIINKLYEIEEPHPKTYFMILSLLESLYERERQLMFLKFILEVLEDLGALPSFSACPICHKPIKQQDPFAFAYQGGLTHRHCLEGNCLEVGLEQIKLLRIIASTKASKIKNLNAPQKVFQDTYRLILRYFNEEFGNILPDQVL